jgi:hypothetical protein
MNKLLTFFTSEKGKGIVRHFVTFIGGALVTLGVLDESLIETITGFGATVIGFVFSLLNKKKAPQV